MFNLLSLMQKIIYNLKELKRDFQKEIYHLSILWKLKNSHSNFTPYLIKIIKLSCFNKTFYVLKDL